MPTFQDNVFSAFDRLQSDYRYVPARIGASSRFASLVRYESDDAYSYIFVSDCRPGGANLTVSLWIAPPDEPGDGLDNLSIGYKVRIANEYNVDDEFFAKCQKKIIQLLPSLPALSKIVSDELKSPIFQTKRLKVYLVERKLLGFVLDSNSLGNPFAQHALNVAKRVSSKKGKIETIAEACMDIANLAISSHILSKSEWDGIYTNDISFLAKSIAVKLYIYSLGELSQSMGNIK